MRSAYSTNIKTAMDMSCALCDAQGRLIAQGLTLPLHLGSIPDAMRRSSASSTAASCPATRTCSTTRTRAAPTCPDFYLFKPILVGETLVGWSVSIGHQTDVGGMTAGGNGSDATEIYQEGLRIPPIKLYDAGRAGRGRSSTCSRRTCGCPSSVLGDVRAQVAGLPRRRARLSRARRALGRDDARGGIDGAPRPGGAAWPATPSRPCPTASYTFTDHIDEDGLDPDPIPIVVTITVAGDRMLVDFEGTAPQVRGAINSPIPFTKSAVYACVRHLIGGDPPNNEGYFRPIEVRAPAGTLVNPVLPASVAARGLTGFRMANAVFGALAQIAPERVFACEAGGDTGISYGGYDADGQPFVFIEFLYGSLGRPARPRRRRRLQQLGRQLLEQPDRDHRGRAAAASSSEYGYVADTGGAGHVPGRPGARPRLPLRGRRGHLPAADRPPTVHAVRPGRRPGRHALDQYPRPRRRSRRAADQDPAHGPSGRRAAPPGRGRRRLGRPAGPRDPARVLHDVREEKLTVALRGARVRRRHRSRDVDPGRGGHRAAARRPASRWPLAADRSSWTRRWWASRWRQWTRRRSSSTWTCSTPTSRASRDLCRDAGVAWRPHVKGIKVPQIAGAVIAAGAIGVTCAKLE